MLSRRRRIVIWALIVVASLIGIGSVLTTWVDRQMLDTQSWADASAKLIQDPEVRDAVSVYLVDELYANVDVAGGLEERLPTDLQQLAAPIAGALRQPATDAVERLLDSPRLQQLWINASTIAQEKLVNVLEDKTGSGITTGSGVVTLDLGELVQSLGAELGLPASALNKIPPDAGELEIMRSDQLATAQAGVRAVRVLSTWLLVLVLGLFALALFLARGERRQTLRNIGCAFVLVGFTMLVVRRAAGNYAVDALTQPSSEDSGQRVWLISTEILAQIGWAAVIYGVVMVAGAVFAGPHAVSLRRRVAPVLNESPGIVWTGVAVVYLVLIVWGPTHALRTLWGIVLLGALIAGGIVALRSQTLREQRELEPAGGDSPTTPRVAGPPVESVGG
jgi:hypothetical protein